MAKMTSGQKKAIDRINQAELLEEVKAERRRRAKKDFYEKQKDRLGWK